VISCPFYFLPKANGIIAAIAASILGISFDNPG